jgi:acyl-CoA synthetase (AMP-forming)/AMP-acid ligase II
VIPFYEGTTGKPKGVEVTSPNIFPRNSTLIRVFSQTTHQNVITIMAIVGTLFPLQSKGIYNVLGILPFYHIFGMHPNCLPRI